MSKLAHAGDSSTVSPGTGDVRCAATTASAIDAARSRARTRRASAAAIAGGIFADQHGVRTLSRNAAASGAKSWPLPSPPAITTSGRAHAGNRRDRRADVRALRVIDEAHAGDVGDPGRAVRQSRERLRAPRAWPASAGPTASPSARAASALAALCSPAIFMRADVEQRSRRAAPGKSARRAAASEIRIRAPDRKRQRARCARSRPDASPRRRGRRRSAPTRRRRGEDSFAWPAHRRQPTGSGRGDRR